MIQAMKRMNNVLDGKRGDAMQKTMVLVTIGALLLTGAAFAAETGDKETAKNLSLIHI